MPDPAPRILLGVSGGIAAYKSAELVRALQGQGMEVRAVMTTAATEFLQPLTLASLTGYRVATSLWPEVPNGSGVGAADPTFDAPIEHIALAQWAQAFVIAPATANTLASFAHGLAGDLLSTIHLATTAPVIVAPAMNVNMLEHPAMQANLNLLRERGVTVVAPGEGYLACGMTGAGRLAEIPEIVAAVQSRLASRADLAGETILVTAGGTREPIDSVRFLGNRSSGKMGHALAAQAVARGARVILITASALPAPLGCEVVRVETAEGMRSAALAALPTATLVIKAAAVADFRPRAIAPGKLRRSGPLNLELQPTPDIVRELVDRRLPGTLIVAFAAETENVLENAREKLLRKAVDAIVANDVSSRTLGFDSDRNAAVFLTRDYAVDLPEGPKSLLANRILDEILTMRAVTTAEYKQIHR